MPKHSPDKTFNTKSPSLGGGEGEVLFILQHREEDVRIVALQAAKNPDIDSRYVTEQIAGWQKARTKLPAWAAVEGIVYPPQISMEQCSSETTAHYKTATALRWLRFFQPPTLFVDLTGGFGVDHYYLAKAFDNRIYIERQEALCDTARHNFNLLGLQHTEVVCGDSTALLPTLPHASLVYADPARRDTHGARTYAISDCTPDVCALLPTILKQCDILLLKLSPMLDWHQAVAELNSAAEATVVREVHIVATGNECKELLLVLSRQAEGSMMQVTCVNDGQTFSFTPEDTVADPHTGGEILADGYLYEPNAAIMKAGCFAEICRCYKLNAIAPNSHLFTGSNRIEDFPGRMFGIRAVTSMNKQELRAVLQGVTQANITVRNFPMTVAELRKRLKIKDGGDKYIFATTSADKRHLLLVCDKIG